MNTITDQAESKISASAAKADTGRMTKGFALEIHNILCHTEGTDGEQICALEISSLVTESIMDALDKVRVKGKDKTLWLGGNKYCVFPDPDGIDPRIAFAKYKERLENFCKKASADQLVPILGLSSLGGYSHIAEFSKLIKEMKSEYPDMVCIIGGSDFRNLTDPLFIKRIFAYGIDMINIGGASEFVDFFGGLDKEDIFFRDEEGFLRIKTTKEIPQNIIFEHQADDVLDITPGEDIMTTSYYSIENKALHYSIKNNPCLNNCGYCATYLHKATPFKESDLRDSIEDCNRYLSAIEETDISLMIENPNPLQYIDKFTRFMLSLDLSKNSSVKFFGDFMGMKNQKIYRKTIKLIDDLLIKWPDLTIGIHFGIDALHYEGDGEFIGRTIGKNIPKEEYYADSFDKLDDFYQRYENNSRVKCFFNLIMHPNLKLDDYRGRMDFAKKYEKVPMGGFPLLAHFNTKIEKDHKGFYLPEYETDKFNLLDFNIWGHFYLDSRYLDCFVFLKNTGDQYFFSNFINFAKHMDIEENDDIFSYFLAWHYQGLLELVDAHNSFKMRFNGKKRKMIRDELNRLVDSALRYLDFMIHRENHITGINPEYDTQELESFLEGLKEDKIEFAGLHKMLKDPLPDIKEFILNFVGVRKKR